MPEQNPLSGRAATIMGGTGLADYNMLVGPTLVVGSSSLVHMVRCQQTWGHVGRGGESTISHLGFFRPVPTPKLAEA